MTFLYEQDRNFTFSSVMGSVLFFIKLCLSDTILVIAFRKCISFYRGEKDFYCVMHGNWSCFIIIRNYKLRHISCWVVLQEEYDDRDKLTVNDRDSDKVAMEKMPEKTRTVTTYKTYMVRLSEFSWHKLMCQMFLVLVQQFWSSCW